MPSISSASSATSDTPGALSFSTGLADQAKSGAAAPSRKAGKGETKNAPPVKRGETNVERKVEPGVLSYTTERSMAPQDVGGPTLGDLTFTSETSPAIPSTMQDDADTSTAGLRPAVDSAAFPPISSVSTEMRKRRDKLELLELIIDIDQTPHKFSMNVSAEEPQKAVEVKQI